MESSMVTNEEAGLFRQVADAIERASPDSTHGIMGIGLFEKVQKEVLRRQHVDLSTFTLKGIEFSVCATIPYDAVLVGVQERVDING